MPPGSGGAAGLDVGYGHLLTGLLGQPGSVGLQDVPAGVGDFVGGAGVGAEFGDEVGTLLAGVGRRGGDQRTVDGRAAGDERPADPPQVQGGDVPLADGLLPLGLGADGFDWEIVFDQGWSVVILAPRLSWPPPAHILDGAEGFGDGLPAAQGEDDRAQGAEVRKQGRPGAGGQGV